MSFRDWPILRQLRPEFLATVRDAMVFGSSGNAALLVTDDNDVYGVGSNSCKCLGVGDYSHHSDPAIVTTLSGKRIKGFAYGGYDDNIDEHNFVIAYDHDGRVYQWGCPAWLLCLISKPQLVDFNPNLRVKVVSCGYSHCMALCDNGKVYTWGENDRGQLGQNKPTEYNGSEIINRINTKPKRVEGLITDKFVTDISCGSKFSVVVLADKRVFTWGCNKCGQLGINNASSHSASPVAVSSLDDVEIKFQKIVCGHSHVIFLSETGDLYLWGNNSVSQLGRSKAVAMYEKPFKYQTHLRFIDIEASYACELSVAVCDNKEIYVWGQVRSEAIISHPMHTQCETIHQVFAFFAKPNIMPKPLREKFHSIQGPSMVGTWKNEFGNLDHSDLIIMVDGKEIPVRKSVLKMRSEYFRVMLERWLENDEKVVTIKENSFAAIEAYLKYLYTDELEVDLDLAAELLTLADEYGDENFKILCERNIKRDMIPEKVAYFLTLTEKFKSWQNLNKFCLKFAFDNAKSVVQSEAFEMWDPDATRTRAFFVKYIEHVEQNENNK